MKKMRFFPALIAIIIILGAMISVEKQPNVGASAKAVSIVNTPNATEQTYGSKHESLIDSRYINVENLRELNPDAVKKKVRDEARDNTWADQVEKNVIDSFKTISGLSDFHIQCATRLCHAQGDLRPKTEYDLQTMITSIQNASSKVSGIEFSASSPSEIISFSIKQRKPIVIEFSQTLVRSNPAN